MRRRYPDGLSFAALRLLETDLLLTRQTLERLAWLESEYERLWTGDCWGSLDRRTLEWNHRIQLRQYRLAVRNGDVTARQRSRLLSRVDTRSSS